jgi:4-hydroxy-tetrahydrodipicolinate synthase
MDINLKGALAALLTPRNDSGTVDWEAFERLCEFTLDRGVTGLVAGGATGDYASLSLDERGRLTEIAVKAAADKGAAVLCGCGATRLADSVELARRAFAANATAVLLPPPHFFVYSQEDLEGFYVEASKQIAGPTLIYNLPAFLTPMQPASIIRLLRANENLVGVKDSSGDLHTLEGLTERPDLGAMRVLGHDRLLVEALRRNYLDAAISGLAGVVPELVVSAFDASAIGDDGRLESLGSLTDELLERVAAMPYPWALTEIAAARELCSASYPFPPSEFRQHALKALHEWLPTWLDRLSTVNLSRKN